MPDEPEPAEERWGVASVDEQEAMVYHTLIREGMTPEEAQAEVARIKALPPEPRPKLTSEQKQEQIQFAHQYAARILAKKKASQQRLNGAGPDQGVKNA